MHWRWNIACSVSAAVFISIGAFLMPQGLGCAIWYPGAKAASLAFPALASEPVLPVFWEILLSFATNLLLWSAVLGAVFCVGDRCVCGAKPPVTPRA